MPIKAVFFDIGWTLVYPETGDWNLTAMTQKLIGKERLFADPALLAKAMKAAEKVMEEHADMKTLAEQEQAFTDYYRILSDVAGFGLTDADCAALSHDRIWELNKFIALDGAMETVKELKAAGYRIGLISDTWPAIHLEMAHYGLAGLADTETFSFEVGYFKPDPRMYQDALDKMGLPCEVCVFVDDLTGNLDGAAKVGIRGIRSLAKPGTVPDGKYPCINGPRDLPALLKKMEAEENA